MLCYFLHHLSCTSSFSKNLCYYNFESLIQVGISVCSLSIIAKFSLLIILDWVLCEACCKKKPERFFLEQGIGSSFVILLHKLKHLHVFIKLNIIKCMFLMWYMTFNYFIINKVFSWLANSDQCVSCTTN